MGVPKVDPTQCTYNGAVAAPDGNQYQATVPCGPYPPGSHVSPFTAWGLFLFGRANVP